MKRYLQTAFVIDLLSSLPFEQLTLAAPLSVFSPLVGILNGNEQEIQFFFGNFLKIFRMLRISKLVRKMDEFETSGPFRLLKLLLFYCFVAHFSGAVFYGIGQIQKAPPSAFNFCQGMPAPTQGVLDIQKF